ncbi:MAG TPA: hypothetical protein VK674_01670 [Candidatus Limnocylindria bacterium]|nr:hypothetical protein [Candidatus Limnocylindria bacterium]
MTSITSLHALLRITRKVAELYHETFLNIGGILQKHNKIIIDMTSSHDYYAIIISKDLRGFIMARDFEREPTTSLGLPIVEGVVESPQFLYIPTPDGESWYKAEAKTLGGCEDNGWRTDKINVWQEPDRRVEGVETPHNHPWPFEADVLFGAYVEQRYWKNLSGGVSSEIVEHKEGDTNVVGMDIYHEVIDVVPGTLTHMKCVGQPEPWGYLDVDSGETWDSNDPTRVTYDSNYFGLLKDMNPNHPLFKPKEI